MQEKGTLPAGLRVYAVGDIHGRFDLLRTLSGSMRRDLAERPAERAVEIYLGDYIDRGPDSRDVVEWLVASPPLAGERICLMGNHEDMLLQTLQDAGAMAQWLFNGGDETIASYLVPLPGHARFPSTDALRAGFIEALPAAHCDFFRGLKRSVAVGGYLFVHAGIHPGRPIDEQDPDDLIWIRKPFLESDAEFGVVVVHGHTPVAAPEARENRINIDTGAVFSGRLTCLVLEGGTRRFLTAGPLA